MEHELRRRGLLMAFFGMLLVSTDSFFIRLADADGFDVTFWIGVLAATVLFVLSVTVHKVNPLTGIRDGRWPLLVVALLQAGSTSMFVHAVTLTAVSNVVVIIAAAPMFAAGLSAVTLGERTSRRVWIAIAAVLVGVLIVVGGSFGNGSTTGDLLALGAIFLFACSLVLLRRYPEVNRTVMVGVAGVGMALIAVVPASLWGHSAKTWLALILMGAVFGPAARVLLAMAPRHLPAAEVGLFVPVETVAASVWAWLFFDEAPVTATIVGGAIIVGAVFWGTWTPRSSLRLAS